MKAIKKIVNIFESIIIYISKKIRTFFNILFPIRTKKIYNRINSKIKKGTKLNVLFIIQFPEMWNSLKSVYEAANENKNINAFIIAVPKIKYRNIIYKDFFKENEAESFFELEGIECISVNKKTASSTINKLKPDFIFLQRPYDIYMPSAFSMYNLSRFAILCYVPYGYEFVNGKHLEIEYNESARNNLGLIFSESTQMAEYCNNFSKKLINKGARRIYDIGYPRFDLLKKEKHSSSRHKTFLYLPRWSLTEENDSSSFLIYYENFISFFEKHKEHNLIIRPHPLMFDHFISLGKLTKKDIQDIMRRVENMENVVFDKNKNYLSSFSESDCLIADYSSLLIEYFITLKPIIYCGKTDSFNEIGNLLAECMYHVSNWHEIYQVMLQIIQDKHAYYNMQAEFSKKIIKDNDKKTGCKIIEILCKENNV